MSTDLITLTQWLSPAYPIGAFSYSHGLETVIANGQIADAEALYGWLHDALSLGSARNDAILCVAAARNPVNLTDLIALARALAPSVERLHETDQQGAAFADVTNAIWALDLPPAPLPVAFGLAVARKDLPIEDALNLYLHAFASNLIGAAQRLMPLGQTDAQGVLARLTPTITNATKTALYSTLDDLGSCTFAADIASMRHETQPVRMFQT